MSYAMGNGTRQKSSEERARCDGVAIFDLDHTLFSANSSFRFGKYLFAQRAFSSGTMIYLVGCYACHKLFSMPLQRLHSLIFARLFKGRSRAAMEKHVQRFLDKNFSTLSYPPAVKRLRELQQRGLYIVILSSSPSFLVRDIAERFGVDAWDATDYGVDKDQRFCTISQLMQGNDKAAYVSEIAERWGIPKQNLWAFSDSSLDLPLLENVGNPVAVQPERRLQKICRLRGWQVI